MRPLFFVCICLTFFNCKEEKPAEYEWKTINVTATAFNSTRRQTNNNPHITAFGDSLKPGLRYIAVSRNLLRLGLTHNTPVNIEGLEGTYLVKDKMHYRWKNKIDVYMGTDVEAARNWGRKRVNISYRVKIKTDSL
ncbi:3D domain-containing protein [Subsaximicrobium wynnwilliamsii]|uniref:3D domain-containing protein n=1 Tax=Subsaximicrobium wynnwilliamsii TaxID=291179 RepID=UPI0016765909|nr:3D domain-containing protein [Subsaximicrobium wynnwilliamsii]